MLFCGGTDQDTLSKEGVIYRGQKMMAMAPFLGYLFGFVDMWVAGIGNTMLVHWIGTMQGLVKVTA